MVSVFTLFLSSSPLSQNVSVELSANDQHTNVVNNPTCARIQNISVTGYNTFLIEIRPGLK
jgi:hypothetical protein